MVLELVVFVRVTGGGAGGGTGGCTGGGAAAVGICVLVIGGGLEDGELSLSIVVATPMKGDEVRERVVVEILWGGFIIVLLLLTSPGGSKGGNIGGGLEKEAAGAVDVLDVIEVLEMVVVLVDDDTSIVSNSVNVDISE